MFLVAEKHLPLSLSIHITVNEFNENILT